MLDSEKVISVANANFTVRPIAAQCFPALVNGLGQESWQLNSSASLQFVLKKSIDFEACVQAHTGVVFSGLSR